MFQSPQDIFLRCSPLFVCQSSVTKNTNTSFIHEVIEHMLNETVNSVIHEDSMIKSLKKM
uniref:Uncharacterized protein n=1 Tax=Schistosoma mansoni TaxID=6183 RepID=A0A5K4F8P3_SCHMA